MLLLLSGVKIDEGDLRQNLANYMDLVLLGCAAENLKVDPYIYQFFKIESFIHSSVLLFLGSNSEQN